MILTDNKERTRFLKFATVGAVGAVIDFGVANLLSNSVQVRIFHVTILSFNFNLLPVYAGTISFICAVTSNFIWNRYWTYPESRSRHVLHQMGMFFLVNLVGIAIRAPILHFVEPVLKKYFDRSTTLSLSPEFLALNSTLAIAIGVVMLWNFFINRYWTYNDVE